MLQLRKGSTLPERIRKIFWFLVASVIIISCKDSGENYITEGWGNARWIAFEQLPDSMLIIPGVHGSGDHLGRKGVKRSTVPMFRREFTIHDPVESASIQISGLGHYELLVNNTRVGDRFLSPGWTLYQKRILYNSYDITDYIKEGGNAVGILVGNGFYNINRERYRKLVIAYGYPRLIFRISVVLKSGTVKYIVSDAGCKVTPSPVTFSSIYGGEDYDATLEQEGWCSFGFDDSAWQRAVVLDHTTAGLEPETDYPLRVMQEFEPRKVSTSGTGRTIYDFGQNASGIISLKVKGNRGAHIRIRPDELINEKGDITQRSGGGPYEFNYTLKGEGIEEWRPRFTYYGFRYADVEIIDPADAGEPTEVLGLKMLHTRNSSPTVGSFSCSDTLFNRIFELINWGIKSNLASVTTDCPHREKLGWLEQTYLMGPSIHFNYDIQALYDKIVTDMTDSQLENGLIPDIAPEYVPFEGGFRDSPEWGSAAVIIPWQLYKWYGNRDVLTRAYPMMKRYVEYLHEKTRDHILDHGLGDWFDLGPRPPGPAQLTPKALTATSIYYYDLLIVARTADMLQLPGDYQRYIERAARVKAAFQSAFYHPETAVCATGSQTSYAMSLYTGIIPEKDKKRVLRNLIYSIVHNDYRLTAGDIGYHFLVRVLSENGRSDILYKMNCRSDRPGYGYQLQKGATALTESWAALTRVSNNHMMLGHLMEWFFTGLGGIYQDTGSVAYNKIIIAPKPVGDINRVSCSFNAPPGMITSAWELEENIFTLDITVPGKTIAKIILPKDFRRATIEVTGLSGEAVAGTEVKDGICMVEPGTYKIIAKL